MKFYYVDEKQIKKRRRILKLKIYGGLAAFFVLLIGAGYLIVYSPLFKIKNISIQYLEVQPPKEVEPLLIKNLKIFFTEQSKIASILGGENILVWKQEKIGEFLKNYPQIAELKIQKDYFERQIKINVKERERFGIWCANQFQEVRPPEIDGQYLGDRTSQSASTTCYWFDANGVLFAEAPAMEGELIKKVSDFSNRPLKLGDKVLEENMLKNLKKIFEVLEKSELRAKNLVLEDLSLQEVVTDSPSIPKIYFSLRFNPEFALPAIQSLKELGLNRIDYIDFRVENRAYYKVK